ncbi:Unknown protein sequence [Pseudomonas syringae pv. maculicola]|nr:Unknown protein sequence [Pseudomonas syringae pv. maculicola]
MPVSESNMVCVRTAVAESRSKKPVLTASTLKLSAWHPTAHSTFRISLPAAISRVDVAKRMVTSYCV